MSLRGGWKIVIRKETRLKQIKYGFQVHKAHLWKKDLTFRELLWADLGAVLQVSGR